MDAAFGWIGEFLYFLVSFLPTWQPIERNERALRYKGTRERVIDTLQSSQVVWYWPAFTEIEVYNMAWQPMTTSTMNVMDKDEKPVAARGFAVWRITDLEKYAVENEGTEEMLDDLICAAIREVATTKSVSEIQGNSRKTTDNALLREVRELTEDLGVEIMLVRLTTFTSTRVVSILGEEAPAVLDEEDEDE